MDIKVVRLFNTYGPRMHPDDGRVVSSFVRAALVGKPLTLFGDGSQTRSFCYVDDIIEALTRMMGTGHEVTGPINLGNPGEFTIRELADLVIETTHSPSTIDLRPLPEDDPVRRRPDISLAREILRWEPTVGLGEGLKRTVEYFAATD